MIKKNADAARAAADAVNVFEVGFIFSAFCDVLSEAMPANSSGERGIAPGFMLRT